MQSSRAQSRIRHSRLTARPNLARKAVVAGKSVRSSVALWSCANRVTLPSFLDLVMYPAVLAAQHAQCRCSSVLAVPASPVVQACRPAHGRPSDPGRPPALASLLHRDRLCGRSAPADLDSRLCHADLAVRVHLECLLVRNRRVLPAGLRGRPRPASRAAQGLPTTHKRVRTLPQRLQ